MKPSAQVLSVNPGLKTLGTLHMPQVLRTRSVLKEIESASVPTARALHYQRLRHVVNALFPTRRSGFELSIIMLLMRMAFAGLLVWRGASIAVSPTMISAGIYGTGPVAFFWTLAALVLFGIGERPATAICAVTFTLLSVMMFSSTVALSYNLLLAAMSVLLCIVGPGWFSADAFIRAHLIRRIAWARNNLPLYQ